MTNVIESKLLPVEVGMAARVKEEKFSLAKRAGLVTKGTLQMLTGEISLPLHLLASGLFGSVVDGGNALKGKDTRYAVQLPLWGAKLALLTLALGAENFKAGFSGKETADHQRVLAKLKKMGIEKMS